MALIIRFSLGTLGTLGHTFICIDLFTEYTFASIYIIFALEEETGKYFPKHL